CLTGLDRINENQMEKEGNKGRQGKMIEPLAEVFEAMSDRREKQGKWQTMGVTLTLIFLAMLSGGNKKQTQRMGKIGRNMSGYSVKMTFVSFTNLVRSQR